MSRSMWDRSAIPQIEELRWGYSLQNRLREELAFRRQGALSFSAKVDLKGIVRVQIDANVQDF